MKVSKSIIFLVKSYLGSFYRHLANFFVVTLAPSNLAYLTLLLQNFKVLFLEVKLFLFYSKRRTLAQKQCVQLIYGYFEHATYLHVYTRYDLHVLDTYQGATEIHNGPMHFCSEWIFGCRNSVAHCEFLNRIIVSLNGP